MVEVVQSPNYIIKANKPNTGTVLKETFDDGKKFQLVLRIAASVDTPKLKNLVIKF